MARNFNRPLTGLLGYIDQKSDGKTPGYLQESSQPTISMDLWLRSNAENFTIASYPVARQVVGNDVLQPIAPTGIPANGVVPEGQMWLLFDIGVVLSIEDVGPAVAIAAGDFGQIQLRRLQGPSSGFRNPLAPMGFFQRPAAGSAVVAGNTYPFAESFRESPFLLYPGQSLMVNYCLQVTAAGQSCRISCNGRILRFSN